MSEVSIPKVVSVKVDDLHPYDMNAKKHPASQIKRLAAAISKYGFDQPIVAWRDEDGKLVIIKGHGRREALISLGVKKAPTIILQGITREKADALRIADNALSSVEYDTKMIASEVSRLATEFDFDGTDFGFTEKDTQIFLGDLSEMSKSVLTEDVSASIEQHKVEDGKKSKELDESEVKIGKFLGCKAVSVAESRTLNRFFASIKNEDESNIQALIRYAGENF